jgi:hypothetical protein
MRTPQRLMLVRLWRIIERRCYERQVGALATKHDALL